MQVVALSALWLPILIAAAVVFLASCLVWMVLPHHRHDWSRLPDEDAVRSALEGVRPGLYTCPHAQPPDGWKAPEWQARAKEGPNAYMTVVPPGLPNMGKSMALWFVYCVVVSLFVAYVSGHALGPGAAYLKVFQIAGTVAFLAYAGAHASGSIWMGHPWGHTVKDMLDGLAYGLLTAGVFGWLWP